MFCVKAFILSSVSNDERLIVVPPMLIGGICANELIGVENGNENAGKESVAGLAVKLYVRTSSEIRFDTTSIGRETMLRTIDGASVLPKSELNRIGLEMA